VEKGKREEVGCVMAVWGWTPLGAGLRNRQTIGHGLGLRGFLWPHAEALTKVKKISL